MAVAGLGGSAVAAAVMGDDAIAMIEEEQHLRVPVIGRQRPAMAEHDRLTFAPVLVEDLNAVLGRDGRQWPSLLFSSIEPSPSAAKDASFTAPIARHFAVDLPREAY